MYTCAPILLQKNAEVLSPDKRKELDEAFQKKKNERLEASMGRKKEMQQLEDLRKEQQKPSDLEQVSGGGGGGGTFYQIGGEWEEGRRMEER